MAGGGATVTGLEALRRKIQQLPDAVEEALRKTARDSALRIAAGMRRRLPAEHSTPYATGVTRESVVVTPHPDAHYYRAEVGPAPHHRMNDEHNRTVFLPNLPVWLEHGTRNMEARPFLRPAVDEEKDRYVADAKAVVHRLAQDLGA